MKLSFDRIKDIALGAARVTQEEDGFHFYRFTQQQQEVYTSRSADFGRKAFSTAGIQFRFRTNSSWLSLKASVSPGSTRAYFAFDICVNGDRIDSLDNFSNVELPDHYSEMVFPLGNFEKKISLGSGEKEVCVYFPWSVKAVIQEVAVEENAFIQPARPSKNMLCFGDSITQGYDVLHPVNHYTVKLAKLLDAQIYNKAIGGEIFRPALAAVKDDFEPDYITVAYGTNDWGRCTGEEFQDNCKGFFADLHANYPDSRIFAITPIWRKDYKEQKGFGDFEMIAEIIESMAGSYQNMNVISGFDLVGHDERLFGDLRLHPNDAGFAQYRQNLEKAIRTLV